MSRLLVLAWVAVALALVARPSEAQAIDTVNNRIIPLPVVTQVSLLAAGSALSQPYFELAVLAYKLVSPNVTITVDFGISSVVQAEVLSGAYDFGLFSSASFLTPAQTKANPDIFQVPFMGVSAVPIYNVPEIPAGSAAIVFSRDVLARIVRGNITRWADPALVADNAFLSVVTANISFTCSTVWAQSMIDVFMSWLCKGDPLLDTTIGCTPATFNPYNITTYAKYIYSQRLTDVVATVASTSNTFGFSTLYGATVAGVSVGNLLTTAGKTLVPSVVATQLPIFERALQLDGLGNSDLTSAIGPNAWPMTQFQFIQLSSTYTRVNCMTRVELARFIKWMFESSVSTALATQLSFVIVPTLISDALGISTTLATGIMCDDIAVLPSSDTTNGKVTGTPLLTSLIPYLLQFYAEVDTTMPFGWGEALYQDSAANLISGATDAILRVNRNHELHAGFYSNPLFLAAPQAIFKLPDAVLNYAGVLPLVADVDTLAAIFAGKINSWLDPRIIQFNPALATAIAATGMDPSLGVIVCCSESDPLAITNLMMGSLRWSSVMEGSTLATLPVDFTTVFNSSLTSVNFTYARQEVDLTALTSSLNGYVGYRSLALNVTDDSVVFRVLPWKGSSVSTSINAQAGYVSPVSRSTAVTSTPANVLNCARGSFSAAGELPDALLDFDGSTLNMASGSIPSNCYPLLRLIDMGVPVSFSGLECDRGNHTLNFALWIANTTAISSAAQTVGLAMVTDIPELLAAYIGRLNQVTCDGKTLLVEQPVVWSMNSALSAVGYAASITALLVCVVTAVLLYFLRDRSVFRSSSVLFLFLTLAGITLMLVAALLWSIRIPTSTICLGFTICSQLGFTLTFHPLFIKTWRIYYIFERRQLKVVKISNSKLSVVVALAVLFDMIVLIAWNSADPITARLQVVDSNSTLHHYTHCSPSSDGMVYFWLLMFTKILALLAGACIGFATRNVNQAFNESKQVAMSIWNVFFSILVLVPIMLLLNTIGNALVALVLFLIIWVCVGTYFFMFVNKFLSLTEWKTAFNNTSAGNSQQATVTSTDGFSFLSMNNFGTDTLVRYIVECERHMAAAKKHFVKLGGAPSFLATLRYLDPLTHDEADALKPYDDDESERGSDDEVEPPTPAAEKAPEEPQASNPMRRPLRSTAQNTGGSTGSLQPKKSPMGPGGKPLPGR